MDWNINFPHLGIYLEHVGKNISIGGFTIAYYGIVIGIGIIGGLMLAQWQAKRTGQDPEMYLDLAMIAVVLSIIGARVYYVVFAWICTRTICSAFSISATAVWPSTVVC